MDVKSRKHLEDALYWIYKSPTEFDGLKNNIDNLLFGNYDLRFNTVIFSSKEDVIQLFNTKYSHEFQYQIKQLGNGIYSFELERKIEKSNILKGRFILIKYPIKSIYLIITHESNRFLKRGILKFLNTYYPKISQTYMESDYIFKILQKFEDRTDLDGIRIVRVVKKGWVRSENAVKKIESEIKWTDLSLTEIKQKISNDEEWIKSIDFLVPFKKAPILKNSNRQDQNTFTKLYCISRNGLFQCSYNFSYMYQMVIEEIAKKAAYNLDLFDNRNLKKENNYRPNPLTIAFEFDLFKNKNENRRLIDVLNKISYSSLSVYHGNPYLHASYVDYKDGSSYDLWILSNDKITIIPQTRSTAAALDRLIESIFTGFREGRIEEVYG